MVQVKHLHGRARKESGLGVASTDVRTPSEGQKADCSTSSLVHLEIGFSFTTQPGSLGIDWVRVAKTHAPRNCEGR